MSGDTAHPDEFWLEQIAQVQGDLHTRLDRLDERLEILAKDVEHYIAHHDQWCAGFSKAVAGAAAVLSSFERYAGTATVTFDEDVCAEESEPDDHEP